MDWTVIGAVVGIPLLRSVGGWATKATEDNKVTRFELRQLLKTVIRTGIVGALIFFGAEGFGIDVSAVGSAATAVIFDILVGSLKENKNVKPK